MKKSDYSIKDVQSILDQFENAYTILNNIQCDIVKFLEKKYGKENWNEGKAREDFLFILWSDPIQSQIFSKQLLLNEYLKKQKHENKI